MPREAEIRAGDPVMVTDGPFAGFGGPAGSVDPVRGRVRLTVGILGDATTVDLPWSDVVNVD